MLPKNLKPVALCATLLLTAFFSNAQGPIIKNQLLQQLPDKQGAVKAIDALTLFLAAKDKPNSENAYVLKSELITTSDLLDEMKGIDDYVKDTVKEKYYYKCYVTNMIQLDTDNYLMQLSYIGAANNYAALRASYRLLAKRVDGKFYIYSPLKQNTISWKTKTYGNLTCHYKTGFNAADVKAYQQKVAFYDSKLNLPNEPINYYYCDNFVEAQQLLGIDYKMDYSGVKYDSFSAHENNTTLVISGDADHPHHFNAHDLWHERLRMAMSKTVINRPVDEGCAYLYGGSWSYTWPELVEKFKSYATANPNADWLSLYTNSVPFESGNKGLYIAYQLNALIVQKIEKEKGFDAVLPLLSCGPRQKGDDNYFAALEKATGITKADFNAEMWKLVKEEK